MVYHKNEFKRIIRPITVVLIIIVSFLWYLVFMSNCNAYLDINTGMPYAIAKDYVHRFGTTIDSEEIKEVKQDYKEAESKLNILIKQYMGEYGINNIDECKNYSDKYYNTFKDKKSEDYSNALSKWGKEEYDRNAKIYDKIESIYWDRNLPVNIAAFKLQSIGDYIEEYNILLDVKKAYKENSDEYFFYNANDQERQVYENRLLKDEIPITVGFFNLEENFKNYSNNWSLLIFICCAITIIPMLVKNKINNVTALQYSTKQGKHILLKQLFAELSANLLISFILIFIFQLFYFSNSVIEFVNCPINLKTSDYMYWFDFTFLSYMLCLWIKTIILVICETFVLFWVSYYGKNYVTAIAVSVPVIVLFYLICKQSNNYLLMFKGYPHFLFPLIISIIVVITVIISMILMRKAKKADYLC